MHAFCMFYLYVSRGIWSLTYSSVCTLVISDFYGRIIIKGRFHLENYWRVCWTASMSFFRNNLEKTFNQLWKILALQEIDDSRSEIVKNNWPVLNLSVSLHMSKNLLKAGIYVASFSWENIIVSPSSFHFFIGKSSISNLDLKNVIGRSWSC